MDDKMHLDFTKQEADAVLSALRDQCEGLGKKGDAEAGELLGGVRERLARARKRGEKLEMDLQGTEVDWVLTAVRNKRLELRKGGKERSGEVLLGVISRIVKARDSA